MWDISETYNMIDRQITEATNSGHPVVHFRTSNKQILIQLKKKSGKRKTYLNSNFATKNPMCTAWTIHPVGIQGAMLM
jgi:hypothetical protein